MRRILAPLRVVAGHVQRLGSRLDLPGQRDLAPPRGPRLVDRRVGGVVRDLEVAVDDHTSGTSSPASTRRNQVRSTSARCRTSPSKDRGRRGCRQAQLVVGQAGALVLEGAPLPVQPARSISRSGPCSGGSIRCRSRATFYQVEPRRRTQTGPVTTSNDDVLRGRPRPRAPRQEGGLTLAALSEATGI